MPQRLFLSLLAVALTQAAGCVRNEPATADTTPPTAPQSFSASPLGSGTATLTWEAAQDEESDVWSYEIVRDGVVIGTTNGTNYSDYDLDAETTYVYEVVTVNGAGLRSATVSISVTTDRQSDATAASMPGNLAATATSPNTVALAWDPSQDPESIIATYEILRDGAVITATTGTTYEDFGLEPETTYLYEVIAINGDSLGSLAATASATTLQEVDTSPPSVPGDLLADATSPTTVMLTWSPSEDPESVISGYEILRDGNLIALTVQTTYVDSPLGPGITYEYDVMAVNGHDLRSDSAFVSVTTPTEAVPPAPITGLNVYHIGHSLVNTDMPEMLNDIATDDSLDHGYSEHVGIPPSLEYKWNNPQDSGWGWTLYIDEIPTGNYDVLVLTEGLPLTLQNVGSKQTSLYTGRFYDLAVGANPNTQVYLYETWGFNTPDFSAWRQYVMDVLPVWELVMDEVNAAHSGSDMYIVPGGQALVALYDAYLDGTVPGLTNFSQLFIDQVHLSDWGNHFIALVHYAVIYKESPVGLTNQTASPQRGVYNAPPPDMAQRMQEIAWEAVVNYPRSGVSVNQN